MLEELKIGPKYDGFLFLAEAEKNPPILQPHYHQELELNLVVRGDITYIVDGKRFSFPKRSLLWLFPDQEHQLIDRSADAQYYVAVFKPSMIQNACKHSFYDQLKKSNTQKAQVLSHRLNPEHYNFLKQAMDLLLQGSLDADILNRQAGFGIEPEFTFEHEDPDALNASLRYLLIQGWNIAQKETALTDSVKLHQAIINALKVMNEEPLHLSLKEIALKSGVSESYLSRLFHRQMGLSLSRYRNSIRLSRFLELYQDMPGNTLHALVLDAGFGSYAQFHKIFTNMYGFGPGEFLGRYKKNS